jgi:hypothetical protein
MMDCSVRFVCEGKINKDGRFEQESGLKPALCVRGKRVALAVINDDLWVRTIELDLVTHDKASFVTYHGEPYQPKPFADRLLMSARLAGKAMTRRSKHILTLLEKTIEEDLPQEILEREVIEQERTYAVDNSPKEKIKAAQKASRPKDVTSEYAGKLFPVNEPQPEEQTEEPPKPATKPAKAVKKIPRTEKAPAPKKPAAAAKGGKPAAERGTLVKRIAAEMKITPFELRILIRATGMRAPYEDEKKVREAIKKGKKLMITAGAKKK